MKSKTFVIVIILFLVPCFGFSEEGALYYFDPNSRSYNYVTLQTEVDLYLKEKKFNLRFQPASKASNFVKFVTLDKPKYIIASPDLVASRSLENQYKIVLRLTRGKKKGFNRILIKKAGSRVKGKQAVIASSSSQKDLEGYFDKKVMNKVEKMKMIQVTKDLDGLLAVYNGQVDYAIISQEALDLMKSVNMDIVTQMTIESRSKQIAYPALMVATSTEPKSDAELKSLVDEFLAMNRSKVGTKILRLMGYEQWKR